MFGCGLVLRTNQECRLSLIDKLGLESKYLESCLVRSENLLRSTEYQSPLRLVRKLADEDEYQSVLDFLLGIFVPAIKPRIFAYYKRRGPQLIAQSSWQDIDKLDRMMVTALEELRKLYDEIRMKGWQESRDFSGLVLTAAWLDLCICPRFALPSIIESASEEAVA